MLQANLFEQEGLEKLPSSAEASLASLLALPGSEEARKMTVTSGQKCAALYQNSSPLGCLVRMCLESSILRSTRCWLTWKIKTTKQSRLIFQLAPSMPRTGGREFSFWLTPAATDGEGGTNMKEGREKYCLRDQAARVEAGLVKMWPTPTTRDFRHSGSKEGYEKRKGKHVQALNEEVCWGENGIQSGGSLNPDWVEWLMGFPRGWTSLETFPE